MTDGNAAALPASAFELEVERLASGGEGIGFYNGTAVFVPLSAPGDRLRVLPTETKKNFMRAEIIEILEPSALRESEPLCPLYGKCGGCNLGHISYPAQLEAKRHFVLDALLRVGGINPPEPVMHSGEALSYRNRAQFRRAASGLPSFSMRASSALVEPRLCPILVPAMQNWLAGFYPEGAAALPRISAAPLPAPLSSRYTVFAHGSSVHLEGINEEVQVRILGKDISFCAGGFFQSNLGLLPELVQTACGHNSGARAADLYSGVGLFASFLKDGFERVTCVEQDSRALGYASRNVGRGADYSAAGMESWVASAQARADFDFVLLDPPRTGLAPSVSNWLLARKPPAVVYVSCDPVTLARDLGILCTGAYIVDELHVFDFFPQTSHVESCVRLVATG